MCLPSWPSVPLVPEARDSQTPFIHSPPYTCAELEWPLSPCLVCPQHRVAPSPGEALYLPVE